MGGLNFSNGKSFDLSHIRVGVSIDSENIFLKKYDSNNNSIFDVDELNALKKDIETFTGNDNKLDETESISLFAHVMGMATDKVKELFWQKDNLVYSSISDLYAVPPEPKN